MIAAIAMVTVCLPQAGAVHRHADASVRQIAQQAQARQEPTAVIQDALWQVLQVAPNEHHRALVVFDERMSYADFEGRVEQLARGERQRFVMNELRQFADLRQHAVLEELRQLEQDGQVSFWRQLWINNSIQIAANRDAVENLARHAGIARIQYDPRRATGETVDGSWLDDTQAGSPPAGSPPASGPRTIFYEEDFETGNFTTEWGRGTTGCGDIAITSDFNPLTGNYHVLMDSESDGCYGTASMTLRLDMSSATTVQLRFGLLDLNDEFQFGSDILEASNDGGQNWIKIDDLSGINGSYEIKTYDLDALGLAYNSTFAIRWTWYDNWSAPLDGFCIDDVQLADFFPPPPPADPEPNIVGHEASKLWDLGYRGDGVVVLNSDLGVDRDHPDLVDRIWQNPNELIDGIDNDGNGFVDDYWGWNFEDDNNEPLALGDHGTNMAGILVGDGSSAARTTGMAPGARMAVCRIATESDQMAATQWGLSVGVDCSMSGHSYKWPTVPKPDYHLHRSTMDMALAAGIIHSNSTGNQGELVGFGYPLPWNLPAPSNCPSPWIHPQQFRGGVSSTIASIGINIADDSHFRQSGRGRSAWDDILLYDAAYPHVQDQSYWDYPYGGFGGNGPALLKPDVAGYTGGVYTTKSGGGYETVTGTSAAAAHVGGALALLISANPDALPRQIVQALQEGALDLGVNGKDEQWGAGKMLVNESALRLLHLLTSDDNAPSLGQTVNISISGPPNAEYSMYYSTALGATTINTVGDLDLQNAKAVVTGFLDASGNASYSDVIPNLPTLIDRSLYLQSICDDRQGNSGQYLFSLTEELAIQA